VPRDLDSLVEVFTAPLVVMPGGWGESLPEWIKGEITLQRMVRLMKGDDDLATDAEATAYLYTASLTNPIGRDWTEIYCYLVNKLMSAKGSPVPDDVRVEKLTDYQEEELRGLKRWIRERQHKVLNERKKVEKRAEQEER